MIEEAVDKSRRIERNELVHDARRQALFGERRRGDGAGGDEHGEILARMRSISGMTASISPTLAPCTQISGPAGRGRLASPVTFAKARRIFLAALEAPGQEPRRDRGAAARGRKPIRAQRER